MTKNNKIIIILAVIILVTAGAFLAARENKKRTALNKSECNISLYTQNEPCVKEYRDKIIAGIASTTISVPLMRDEPKSMQATLNERYENNLIGLWDQDDERGSVAVITDKLSLFSKDIALMPIAVNEGGSGEFLSIAAFHIVDGKLKGVEAYSPLGDRINFDKIEQIGKGDKYPELGTISVRFLTHGEDQAMADEPNQPETLIVKLLIGEDGKLKFGEPVR